MSEKNKRLEFAAYIALTIVALGVAIWYVRLPTTSTPVQPKKKIQAGFQLGEPAEWSAHPKTIVLALQRGCHFCAESAPFYRRLAVLLGNTTELHVTAVLPQTVSQSQAYLRTLGLEIGDIRQANLASLHIPGTPTLLLVDDHGIVKNVWVGKLTPIGERQVLSTLGLPVTQ